MKTLPSFIILCFLSILSMHTFGQILEATESKALLHASVTSMNGKARQGDIISFQGIKSKQVYKGITDESGRFSILLPEGDTYLIKYKTFTGNVNYDKLPIPNKAGAYTFQLNIQYDPPKTYTLDNVFFDTGKASLRPQSFIALNDLVELMTLKPQLEIEIAGHTDNVGTAESNITLSLNRAKSVRNYLISKGIDANRVSIQGYGDTQPIASNDSAEGRQKNRRTVVNITKE